MNECEERICYVKGMCDLLGGCILNHRLLQSNKNHVHNCIKAENPAKREKMIIAFMSEKEKMKVRGYQVGSYFKWKGRTGIDPDRLLPTKRDKKKRKYKSNKAKRVKVGKMMKQISKDVFKKINNKQSPVMARRPMSIDEYYQKAQKPIDIIEKWRTEPEPNFHEPE